MKFAVAVLIGAVAAVRVSQKTTKGADMSEAEAKDIFDKCAGADGSLSLKEAMDCAKESGHGKHAGAMKKHWPKDAEGKPIEVTWADAKKAWNENNSLAQAPDMSEAEAKDLFDKCAGDDGSLSLKEAQGCAKENGHGDKTGAMRKHWPKDAAGNPIEVTWADAKKAWNENQSLAQGPDMSEAEAKDLFDKCAGSDGSLSLKEAMDCAKENGHGKKAGAMRKHWPKDAAGNPIEVTWADAKKAWEEHNSLAQGPDMSEEEAHQIFMECSGDGSMSLNEAMDCAQKHGHGDHAGAMKKHWPRDAEGKPIEVTWDDAKKAFDEHNSA